MIPDHQSINVFRRASKLAVRLGSNLPGTTEQVEVIDVGGPKVCLQRTEHRRQRDIQTNCFGAVQFHEDRRIGGPER